MIATVNMNGPYGSATGVQIPSIATCKLLLFRDDIQLSTASGFLIESEDALFLITALHNITGRNYFTRRCLDPQLSVPNRIETFFASGKQSGELDRYRASLRLYKQGEPTFLYDWSDEGGDVAALKIDNLPGDISFVTMADAERQNWTRYVGLDVFALGYPSSLDANGTPIWKRVSIASEPSQRVNGRKTTLLDGLTYHGMSGGPVIISQASGFTDENAYVLDKKMMIRVIGVYGGRYDTDADKSGTLGFYWPIETAYEIIECKRKRGNLD